MVERRARERECERIEKVKVVLVGLYLGVSWAVMWIETRREPWEVVMLPVRVSRWALEGAERFVARKVGRGWEGWWRER